MKVVIVGGVAGGASAAARLRRLNEQAEIVLFERGEYISFANCGLPYYVGGQITDSRKLTLQTPSSFAARFHVDVRAGSEVTAIDPEKNLVSVRESGTGRSYTETYDFLLLSPGAEPLRPAFAQMASERVFTLRNIPDTLRIRRWIDENHPQSAVIVGGGYIGVEMAENLVEAGLTVTVVELAGHLIAPLDVEMAADVQGYLRKKGVRLLLNQGVSAIEETGAGLKLQLGQGEMEADMLLLCVGVRPETQIAKACGIATNARGAILVDARMRTNIPNIYAVGDAVEIEDFVTKQPGYIPLAGPANRQGRIAADQICGLDSTYAGTQGSAVLKLFDMTVATTGVNERGAQACGIDYDKTYLYAPSHAAYYPGATHMSIKVLWEKATQRLLGAQIVGFTGVDKRMDVLATALRLGAKVTDLAQLELCYAPPYSSAKDPVNMLGFVAENVLTGKVRQFFWDQVDDLPRDGSVTLLDVRTQLEYASGHIGGFIHIPLDRLRDSLAQLPKDKPVYVHCQSGLRSYIACRMLSGHGFACANLAGGWHLYDSVKRERQAQSAEPLPR